jgi:hypothetical protein
MSTLPKRPGRPPNSGTVAGSWLQVRCTPAQKARWVRAAGGKKLSEWVVRSLNAAAWSADVR